MLTPGGRTGTKTYSTTDRAGTPLGAKTRIASHVVAPPSDLRRRMSSSRPLYTRTPARPRACACACWCSRGMIRFLGKGPRRTFVPTPTRPVGSSRLLKKEIGGRATWPESHESTLLNGRRKGRPNVVWRTQGGPSSFERHFVWRAQGGSIRCPKSNCYIANFGLWGQEPRALAGGALKGVA
ncbi:hypothetical protein C8R47DRAFT_1082730 [Mycena vitilis]|nr:hypothetical protein C8R47DRAFT_1082730 [Mycena vitilis]